MLVDRCYMEMGVVQYEYEDDATAHHYVKIDGRRTELGMGMAGLLQVSDMVAQDIFVASSASTLFHLHSAAECTVNTL